MKRFSLIALLLAFCIFGNGIAGTDTIRGKIKMNTPNAPTPTVEINLDKTYFNLFFNSTINLPKHAEYVEMIEGVFILSYDKKSENLTKMKSHYQKNGRILSRLRTNSTLVYCSSMSSVYYTGFLYPTLTTITLLL